MGKYIPVTEWGQHHKWPTVGSLRNMISAGKLDAVIRRVGRRVLIDEEGFWKWVGSNGSKPVIVSDNKSAPVKLTYDEIKSAVEMSRTLAEMYGRERRWPPAGTAEGSAVREVRAAAERGELRAEEVRSRLSQIINGDT